MSAASFLAWAARLLLPKTGITLIACIRKANPVRRTQGRRNVRGEWSSVKMGHTIQFEAIHTELERIIELEYDPHVLEYYDQPWTLTLRYADKTGHPRGCKHTPDLFVIGEKEAWFEECKTEEKLRELALEMPNRYERQPNGSWRCLPGEQCAAKYGVGYKVRSSLANNPDLTRNLLYLGDYLRRDCNTPAAKVIDRLKAAVRSAEGITYAELLNAVPDATSDDVNYVLARGVLHTDLHRVLLADRSSVTIYSDSQIAGALREAKNTDGECITTSVKPVLLMPTAKVQVGREEYTITEVSARAVHLLREDGTTRVWQREEFEALACNGHITGIAGVDARQRHVQSRIRTAGPAALRCATARWAEIQRFVHDPMARKPNNGRARRQLNRLIGKYRMAKAKWGNGFIGLIPEPRTGNRTPRLLNVEPLMQQYAEQFETLKQPTMLTIYRKLSAACRNAGLDAPSCKSFNAYLRRRPQYMQIRKRRGPRAAYQRKPFYWLLDLKTPVHGDRPWEVAHIDHTVLDIELVCLRTGKNLGRPCLTLMIDAYTRRILAISLSFSSERSQSNMRVLRECVRRHHRLPTFLVVDKGKGFESAYFDSLLAAYEISKKSRPSAHPRHGSVAERIFGTTNSQFIHYCVGNTQSVKNVRETTKSIAPKKLAIWTLESLTKLLKEYCYEVYDIIDHPALGVSPRQMMELAMKETGERSHMIVAYDQLFEILTLPTTERGVAKVNIQKGIRINYLDYFMDGLEKHPEIDGVTVGVRYDPDDASKAWAFIKGEWRPLVSTYSTIFKRWSRAAVDAASAELLQHRRGIAADRNNSRASKRGDRKGRCSPHG